MDNKRYGFFGWKEIENNRADILSEYERSKKVNQSRPVKTDHGCAGEAAIRQWLKTMLPEKYGVTSGYIIPDVIFTENYKLYHYDIIIYDKINSPILWVDGNYDQSSLGKKRAIPGQYVKSVMEVKAKFTKKSTIDALKKIKSLQTFSNHLSSTFFSSIVFIEIDEKLPDLDVLKNLLPQNNKYGYIGGLILKCYLNPDMAGQISLIRSNPEKHNQNVLVPIAKDIDKLDIYLNHKGDVQIFGAGEAVTCFSYENKWHYSKSYGPVIWNDHLGISLNWSYNSFAKFTLDILSYLEGNKASESQYFFGQVFDVIKAKC